MEIVRLSETKVKLSLETEEMKKYGITEKELASDTVARRRALWTLLDEVKNKTGVDAARGRTLVEAFPGRCGGCEIFVTVLAGKKEIHTALFRFDSFAHLCEAARRICDLCPDAQNSALYALPDGAYLLSLPLEEKGNARTPSPYSFLEEYGKRESDRLSLGYAKEYGRCLYASDALLGLLSAKEDFPV